jgi:hypothetical protein
MKINWCILVCVCIAFIGCHSEKGLDNLRKVQCFVELSPTGAVYASYVGLKIKNNSEHLITLPYTPAISEGDNISHILVTPGNSLKTYDSNTNLVTNSIVNDIYLKELDKRECKEIIIVPGHTWELPARRYELNLKAGTYTMVFTCRIKMNTHTGYYYVTSQPAEIITK